MTWADRAIKELIAGNPATVVPHGSSMLPLIRSGQRVTIQPFHRPAVGDVVLCRVNGRVYLHKVLAVDGDRFQIGNNRGRVNGWTRMVYGVADMKDRSRA